MFNTLIAEYWYDAVIYWEYQFDAETDWYLKDEYDANAANAWRKYCDI